MKRNPALRPRSKPSRQATSRLIGKTIEFDCYYGGHYRVKVARLDKKGIKGEFSFRSHSTGEWMKASGVGFFTNPDNIYLLPLPQPLTFPQLLNKFHLSSRAKKPNGRKRKTK